jgi:hypothetical protein
MVTVPGVLHAVTGNTDFVVVALSIPATGVTFTAPSTPGGWTQFSGSPASETGYSFAAFWHVANSSENGTGPTYTFTSSDTSDGGEILAAIYHNSCVSNTSGACSDPISASQSLAVTTASATGTFATGAGSLTVPSNGMPVVLAGAASGFANDSNIDQLTLSGSPPLTQRGGAQEFCGVEEFDSSHGIAGGSTGPYTVQIANYVNGTSHAQGGQVFFTLSPRTN